MLTVDYLAPVQDLFHEVEERMLLQSDGYHAELGAALRHLLGSGGKRIRVAVTLLAGRMFNAERDRLVTLAAAIELLHTATLVHDDLIDGALIRRGLPTLNAQWTPAATVLTGDFIFGRAAKLASQTDSLPVIHLFAETVSTIVNGEISQMFGKRGIISREEYNQRIFAKTASLFETATKSAALVGEADGNTVSKLAVYGREVGMAFQIIDDVLDFTGEQTTVGKPVANDLRQGLVTLPVMYYCEIMPDDPDLGLVLSKRPCDEQTIDRLVESIRRSGAINRAMQEADRYVQRGLAALNGLPEKVEKRSLIDLAKFVTQRNK